MLKIDWSQIQIQNSCYRAWELERKLSQEVHSKLMKGKPIWYSTILRCKRAAAKQKSDFAVLSAQKTRSSLLTTIELSGLGLRDFPLVNGKQRGKTLSHGEAVLLMNAIHMPMKKSIFTMHGGFILDSEKLVI